MRVEKPISIVTSYNDYLNFINGKKLNTIRIGVRIFDEPIVELQVKDRPDLKMLVRIVHVEYLPYDRLTTTHAKLNGYHRTLEDLKVDLEELYGYIHPDEIVSVIWMYPSQ